MSERAAAQLEFDDKTLGVTDQRERDKIMAQSADISLRATEDIRVAVAKGGIDQETAHKAKVDELYAKTQELIQQGNIAEARAHNASAQSMQQDLWRFQLNDALERVKLGKDAKDIPATKVPPLPAASRNLKPIANTTQPLPAQANTTDNNQNGIPDDVDEDLKTIVANEKSTDVKITEAIVQIKAGLERQGYSKQAIELALKNIRDEIAAKQNPQAK